MPRPSEENPTRSSNNPHAMSFEFLYEVNERLIEWLKQEATKSDDESSEEDIFFDEEEPDIKTQWTFGRIAHRVKKWLTDHYRHES
ncbi:hypothetical protein FMEXI_670 [Fusarium mexicanum]|uniref:Uncharacterized protein n=1 Tax=Fusarium mexicanum TaxID=751941 RepID=A0A8H5JQP6_9HYPO|nr:hypothetical protein FMEXI_670 [Fusarium mexicanum]